MPAIMVAAVRQDFPTTSSTETNYKYYCTDNTD